MPDEKVDFFSVVARRKLGVSYEWCCCKYEAVGPDFTIEGGIPKTLKAGPDKGKKSFRNVRLLKCVVTRTDLMIAHNQYEANTGLCWQCQGSKVAFDRECERCGGTGEAPKLEVG